MFFAITNVHLTWNRQIYIQVDRVAMDSPLDPSLDNIFMIELESSLIPNLSKIKLCRLYVDDTICFIKIGSIECIILVLHSFHRNIQVTYEVESNVELPYLDLLLMQNDEDIIATVYQKESNSDVYLHCDSHMPVLWKRRTLKTLVKRSYSVQSPDY